MRNTIAIVIVLALLVSLAACNGMTQPPAESVSDISSESSASETVINETQSSADSAPAEQIENEKSITVIDGEYRTLPLLTGEISKHQKYGRPFYEISGAPCELIRESDDLFYVRYDPNALTAEYFTLFEGTEKEYLRNYHTANNRIMVISNLNCYAFDALTGQLSTFVPMPEPLTNTVENRRNDDKRSFILNDDCTMIAYTKDVRSETENSTTLYRCPLNEPQMPFELYHEKFTGNFVSWEAYYPIRFLPDDRLLVELVGWEWQVHYEIMDSSGNSLLKIAPVDRDGLMFDNATAMLLPPVLWDGYNMHMDKPFYLADYEQLTVRRLEWLEGKIPRDGLIQEGRSNFPIVMSEDLSRGVVRLQYSRESDGWTGSIKFMYIDFEKETVELLPQSMAEGLAKPLAIIGDYFYFRDSRSDSTGEIFFIKLPEGANDSETTSYQTVEAYPPIAYPVTEQLPEGVPGALEDFECRSVAAPTDVLDALSALDVNALWAQGFGMADTNYYRESMNFAFDRFEINIIRRDTVSDIELVVKGKTYRIFSANQPIMYAFWMNTHTLALKVINAIYLGDSLHDYYAYDLATGIVEKIAFSYPRYDRTVNLAYPSLSSLHDYHVWHYGMHLFFGLSPNPEGPEQKHVFAQQEGGDYQLIAEDVWDWVSFHGELFYKNDDSGNVYAVDLIGNRTRIAYTDENPYERITIEKVQEGVGHG